MQAKNAIDFKKIDWSRVDREKAEFFYKEAVEYNNRLMENINNLNSKAFSLLAIALSVLSAAIGFLLSFWGQDGKDVLSVILLSASFGLIVTLILLLLAVFPRGVYLSGGAPRSFFTDNFYKADMHHQFSFGIASLHKYIGHNQKIESCRSRFLLAGMLVFIATPLFTIGAFLIHHLNQ
jgi:hypothetical protein